MSGTPFGRLVRVEAVKSVDTRGARWLLLVAGALAVLMAALAVARPRSFAQSLGAYADLAGAGPALLAPVLVILLVTSEWTARTALTTFVLEPRRGRVLAAKSVVAMAVGACGALLTAVVAVLALAVSAALGRATHWSVPPGRCLGLLLGSVLGTVGAVAAAALLQSTAAAVAASFALPVLVAVLAPLLGHVAAYVDVASASERVLRDSWSGAVVQVLTAHLVWVALPMAAGTWRWSRRDAG